MRFRSDPAKAAANLRKHGVSFADAEGALQDPLAVSAEDPDAEGEHVLSPLAWAAPVKLLVVVWTESDDEYRVISARRPTRKERKQYEG